jgi:His/Glu/Gln/Arg/opine family amino acid ABC transporter permease subunit
MEGKLFDVGFMFRAAPEILSRLPITLSITFVSLFFSLIIGFLTAIARLRKVPVLTQIFNLYILYVRGTPLLIQIYMAYYGLPLVLLAINREFGTDMNINNIAPIIFIYIAYSLNEGAYASETFRAAIESVDRGQAEAAHSIGMTPMQAMIRIIMPEALKVAVPNFGNNLLGLVKNTSLAFSISGLDIVAAAQVVGSRSFRFCEVYIVLSVIYWIACGLLTKVVQAIEKSLNAGERGVAA